MKPTHRDTTTHPPDRERQTPNRDGAADRKPGAAEREHRISATQMAAPSTRRWRRAGRFEPTN
jgi:hypothetical protein